MSRRPRWQKELESNLDGAHWTDLIQPPPAPPPVNPVVRLDLTADEPPPPPPIEWEPEAQPEEDSELTEAGCIECGRFPDYYLDQGHSVIYKALLAHMNLRLCKTCRYLKQYKQELKVAKSAEHNLLEYEENVPRLITTPMSLEELAARAVNPETARILHQPKTMEEVRRLKRDPRLFNLLKPYSFYKKKRRRAKKHTKVRGFIGVERSFVPPPSPPARPTEEEERAAAIEQVQAIFDEERRAQTWGPENPPVAWWKEKL